MPTDPLVIDYPKLLPDAMQTTRTEFEHEARMAMAVKLFEMRRLSSGLAAKLAGVDRMTFLLGLHQFGVAMIDLEEDELKADGDRLMASWSSSREVEVGDDEGQDPDAGFFLAG